MDGRRFEIEVEEIWLTSIPIMDGALRKSGWEYAERESLDTRNRCIIIVFFIFIILSKYLITFIVISAFS